MRLREHEAYAEEEETYLAYWLENLTGRDYWRDLGVQGRGKYLSGSQRNMV
jgi:hypothetical protein